MSATFRQPASRKVYVKGKTLGVRVPMREIFLKDNPPLRLYDTSGPYADPESTPDLKLGLPPLRKEWILSRGDVEPGPGLGVRAKAGKTVTQMHYARRGEITPEMEFIAIREGGPP